MHFFHIVCVTQGPPNCGKSTLIRSLVKIYTGQNLIDTTGPITMVAGRRRITIFECSNDIHTMTDLAKVADMVLLMIDGSYGIEMETFEFLNLLQLHGLPKVVGLLTHLDKFKANKVLQRTKKALKHRFWTEIYDGAKMFDFSGIVNGKYLKHEVKRLALFIGRVKFRPLVWKNSHPYVLVDRIEDVTPSSRIAIDEKCDRDVAFYGYVRGTHLKPGIKVHLVGVGDYSLDNVTALEDPCRTPGRTEQLSSLRKEFKLFAPMANTGKVCMDRYGIYVDERRNHQVDASSRDSSKGKLFERLTSMQGIPIKNSVDENIKNTKLFLFEDGGMLKSSILGSSTPSSSHSKIDSCIPTDGNDYHRRDAVNCNNDISFYSFLDDSVGINCIGDRSDDQDLGLPENIIDSRWKFELEKKAAFIFDQRRNNDETGEVFWMREIYGADWDNTKPMDPSRSITTHTPLL